MFRSYDGWKLQSPEDSGFYRFDEQDDDEEEEDMARTRFEISISFQDAKGTKRWVNALGNLWLDQERGLGQIELPPGVALVGGTGYYINVNLPRERDAGGGGGRQQRGQADEGEPNW